MKNVSEMSNIYMYFRLYHESKHNNNIYQCRLYLLCSLKMHIQSVHEKIKYSCNQCDHQASSMGNLKTHVQSVHEKIKYSCNQCDHQATTNGHLKTHIQSVHENIKYSL